VALLPLPLAPLLLLNLQLLALPAGSWVTPQETLLLGLLPLPPSLPPLLLLCNSLLQLLLPQPVLQCCCLLLPELLPWPGQQSSWQQQQWRYQLPLTKQS